MRIPGSSASYLLGVLISLSLVMAACGNNDASPASPTAQATAEAPPEVTASPTSPLTAEPTSQVTSRPTQEPTPEPTTTPTTEPTDGPTVTSTPAPTAAPTVEATPTPTPEPTPTPDVGTIIEVEVAGGKPVGGVKRHRIDARDSVTITVIGDTADELHIHGYDLVVRFVPGQPGSITFEANIPGIFEAETHHHGDLVMELEVR